MYRYHRELGSERPPTVASRAAHSMWCRRAGWHDQREIPAAGFGLDGDALEPRGRRGVVQQCLAEALLYGAGVADGGRGIDGNLVIVLNANQQNAAEVVGE